MPIHELDAIMPTRWSLNTFKTSTTSRLQPSKSVEIALLERKKVFFDHSECLCCQGRTGAPAACKDMVRKVVLDSFKGLIVPWAQQASRAKAQGAHQTNLGEAKISRQVDDSDLPLGSHFNKRLL